jgi:serine/threonine protein kinase
MEKTNVDELCVVCEEIEYKHVFNLVNISTAMYRIAKFRQINRPMDRVEIVWVQILEPLAIAKAKVYVGDHASSLLNVNDSIPDIPTTTAKLAWAIAELRLTMRYELVEFLKEQCKLYASCFSAKNFASIFWAFAKLNIDAGEAVGSIMRNCLWEKLPDCNARDLWKLAQGLSNQQLASESFKLLIEVMLERALSIILIVDCPGEICALFKLLENLRHHMDSGLRDFQQIQFDILLKSAVVMATTFRPEEICCLLCTMARLELSLTQDLETALKERSIVTSADFQIYNIVDLFWAFAKHRGKFAKHRVTMDRRLEASLREIATSSAERFSPLQLKTMEWAFARLNMETWHEIIRNEDGNDLMSSPPTADGKIFGKFSASEVSDFLECFKQESSVKKISHSSLSRLHCQALLHLQEFFVKGSVDDDSMDVAVIPIVGRNCGSRAALANLPLHLRKEHWTPGVVLGCGKSGAVSKVVDEQGIARVLKLRYRVFVDRLQSVRKLQKQLKDEAFHFIEIQSVHLPQFLAYKLCTDEDLVWMLVQHIHGENLDQMAKRQGIFSQSDAVEVGASVLSGLEKIHQHVFWVESSVVQLTHSDVRPCNVVYRKEQNLYVLVDCSFSLLEYADECVCSKRFPYSSPQLFEGCQASPSDDLWSVGILLYKLVSGQFPFEAMPPYGLRDWIHAIEDSEAARGLLSTVDCNPSHTNFRSLTPAFEGVVLRALSKDIYKRFPDARAMIKGLPTERKPNKECFESLMSTLARSCLCRLWLDCWKRLNSKDWEETKECVKCCMMRPEIQKRHHHSYILVEKSQGRLQDWDITALTQLLRTIYLHEYKNIKISERLLPHDKYLLRDENGVLRKVKTNDIGWNFVDDGVQGAEWKYRFEKIGFERNFLRHHSEIQDIPEDVFWTHWEAVKKLLVELGEEDTNISEGCRRILERKP